MKLFVFEKLSSGAVMVRRTEVEDDFLTEIPGDRDLCCLVVSDDGGKVLAEWGDLGLIGRGKGPFEAKPFTPNATAPKVLDVKYQEDISRDKPIFVWHVCGGVGRVVEENVPYDKFFTHAFTKAIDMLEEGGYIYVGNNLPFTANKPDNSGDVKLGTFFVKEKPFSYVPEDFFSSRALRTLKSSSNEFPGLNAYCESPEGQRALHSLPSPSSADFPDPDQFLVIVEKETNSAWAACDDSIRASELKKILTANFLKDFEIKSLLSMNGKIIPRELREMRESLERSQLSKRAILKEAMSTSLGDYEIIKCLSWYGIPRFRREVIMTRIISTTDLLSADSAGDITLSESGKAKLAELNSQMNSTKDKSTKRDENPRETS